MVDVNLIRTVWTGVAGAPYYSSIHVVPTLGSDLQACVDAWKSLLGDIDANCVTGLTWTVENESPVIDSVTGQMTSVDPVTGGTGAGSASGDPLPRTSQLLIRWSTGAVVNGRRRRGRTFIPGLIETLNVSPGVPSGTVTAATAAQASGFITACGGSAVVYSRTHGTVSPITGATVWDQWASLRSRRD